jgi:hypothetical protein
MKKRDVSIGGRYRANVTGRPVVVRIVRDSQYGGWEAVNESTGRTIRVRSAQRLHGAVA